MRVTAAFALLVSATAAVHAGDWNFFTAGGDGESYYYDEARMTRLPYQVVQMWVKTDAKAAKKPYATSMLRFTLNCGDKTLAITSATRYDATGGVLSSVETPLAPRVPAVPESIGEIALSLGCEWEQSDRMAEDFKKYLAASGVKR